MDPDFNPESAHRLLTVWIFWIASVIGVPFGILFCRAYRPLTHIIFALMVLCLAKPTWSITFFSEEYYKAATRGFEIHISDLFAVILACTMLLRSDFYRINFRPPLLILTSMYVFVALISWLFVDWSPVPNFEDVSKEYSEFHPGLYPLFEISKILRGFFIYWVCVNLFGDETNYRVFAISVCLLIIYFTLGSLNARYHYSMNRATVYPFHENDLNTIVGMLGAFLLPWAFGAKRPISSLFFWLLSACALVTIILTISRSSLFGYFLSCFILSIICLGRFGKPRNYLMVFLALIIALGLLGKAMDTLMERLNEEDTWEALKGRSLMNDSAILMAEEHPLGVGLGNFVLASFTRYAALTGAEIYNIAHNGWFLTLGELGLLGLIIFVAIWVRIMVFIFKGLFLSLKLDNDKAFCLILGVLGAFIVLHIQNLYHFSFRQTSIFFLTQILAALAIRLYLDMKNKVLESKEISV